MKSIFRITPLYCFTFDNLMVLFFSRDKCSLFSTEQFSGIPYFLTPKADQSCVQFNTVAECIDRNVRFLGQTASI